MTQIRTRKISSDDTTWVKSGKHENKSMLYMSTSDFNGQFGQGKEIYTSLPREI